jgi:predicted nucleic acid-binding protein
VYTLDTNTLIYYLARQQSVVETLDPIFANDAPIFVSTITELELLSFSNLSSQDFSHIANLLRATFSVGVDSRIARIAATIRRRTKIDTPDAVIAATAVATGTTLLTRNTKDFGKIKNLAMQPI